MNWHGREGKGVRETETQARTSQPPASCPSLFGGLPARCVWARARSSLALVWARVPARGKLPSQIGPVPHNQPAHSKKALPLTSPHTIFLCLSLFLHSQISHTKSAPNSHRNAVSTSESACTHTKTQVPPYFHSTHHRNHRSSQPAQLPSAPIHTSRALSIIGTPVARASYQRSGAFL